MSYLLVQIWVCLLIAGIIGFLIGWLFFGKGKKKALLDNNLKWENTLGEKESGWNSKLRIKTIEIEKLNREKSAFDLDLQNAHNDAKLNKKILDEKRDEWGDKLTQLEKEYQSKIDRLTQELTSVQVRGERCKDDLKTKTEALLTLENSYKDKLNQSKKEMEGLEREFSTLEKEYTLKLNQAHHELSISKESNSEWKDKVLSSSENLGNLSSLNRDNSKQNNQQVHLFTEELKDEKKDKKSSKPMLLTKVKDGEKDDFTLIKGIGKILEKRLNELGVYHFKQIASWSDENAIWIDEYMSFRGRVLREEWVKQAKKLAKGDEKK